MKNFFKILGLVAMVSLAGCTNPKKADEKAKVAVHNQEAKISDNVSEQKDHGRDFAFAAQFALTLDPTPSEQSKVASSMLERSMNLLGNPDYDRMLEMQETIKGLLSTNVQLKAHAEKSLARKDAEIGILQTVNHANEDRLKSLLAHLDKVTAENAGYAQTWVTIKHTFWWIIWIAIGVVVFRIVMAIAPAPYNQLGHIPDLLFGWLSRLFLKVPAAAKYAGVVSAELYDKTKTALEHTVSGIELAKERFEKDHPEALVYLKNCLIRGKEDQDSKDVVNAVKAAL